MKHLSSLFAAAILSLSLPGAAHADVFTTFNVVATMQSGTVSGTVTFDDTTDLFTGSNIKATYSGTNYVFTGAPVLFEKDGTYTRIHFSDPSLANSFFGLDLTTGNLTGYKGGTLCSIDVTSCHSNAFNAGLTYTSAIGTGTSTALDDVVSGSLVPQTPEPSSLVLLGTGALSLAGAARRRIRKA